MDKQYGTFRKVAFGGFNRKDVISYIEKMKNETFEYKTQVEQTVKSLNEKIAELENAIMPAGDGRSSVCECESFGDIKDATEHLKSVADELCQSLGDFIEKLTRKGICDVTEIEAEDFRFEDDAESDEIENVISTLSFLNASKKEEKITEREEGPKNVEDILSTLSFLK